ncbi:MAG TPA: phosphatase PAP2 family protein [Mycobacteriales bacterium]|nr:phosphatase PAP2 family protein [Mycobacteriales bacterium]
MAMVVTATDSWDRHAFRDVNQFARDTSWLHGVMTWFANDGLVLLAIALVIGWWLGRRATSPRTVAIAVWGPLGALVALGIAQPISDAVNEKRPFVAMPHALTLIHHASDAGFPSDHSTAAGAVAMALLLVSWQLGVVSTLIALIIAFSRVYVGVHYPDDVAAGLVLGAVVVAGGLFIVVPIFARIIGWMARTPLRPLIAARDPA